jgi:CRP/FNR family transcriptional regulator, anaerobic regulatory protein
MTSNREPSARMPGEMAKPSHTEKSRACDYCELRNRGFCGRLTEEQQTLLAARSRLATLDAHRTLFRQGEETDHVYVVRNGLLRLYQRLRDGRRQVIGFAKPGDLLLFPLSAHNDYSADALDSAYLCQFRREDFISFLRRDPELWGALAISVHEDLLRARRQGALLGQRGAEPKVAQFLITLHESYGRPNNETTLVPVRVPQADIADFLGMTVETVNRTLARFVRDAIITIAKRGIDFLDLRRLKAIAESA